MAKTEQIEFLNGSKLLSQCSITPKESISIMHVWFLYQTFTFHRLKSGRFLAFQAV